MVRYSCLLLAGDLQALLCLKVIPNVSMEGDVIHIHLLLRHLVLFCTHLLISWLQSPSAVIFEPPKLKFDIVSTVSPSIYHEVMGPDGMILSFLDVEF